MNKKTKFCIQLMMIAVGFLLLGLNPMKAKATSRSQNEAISWCESKVGTSVGYNDGSGQYQCVEFIQAYYQYLGVSKVSGNARDYATNALPSGWSRVQGGVPQKGDILVYSGTSGYPYGHVSICGDNTNTSYHQNYKSKPYVTKESFAYNSPGYINNYTPYWGYIRPNWPSSGATGEMTTPTISTDSYYYDVGLTMNMSWEKTASNTDFYQYWVIVRNSSTGEETFAGASGGNGDVNCNSLSIRMTKAGVYYLTVYAVPYNNKDVRQKAATKTVVVGAVGNMTTPTITTNAERYSTGSVINMNWQKTNPHSDFYQYWVIVRNTSTGEEYFGDTSGSEGNVNYNSISIKAPKEGKYLLRVYAVPYKDKDTRQKVDTKYVVVESSHKPETKIAQKNATCTQCGVKEYYQCMCGKYFSDSACKKEIKDLNAWKNGDGKVAKKSHTTKTTIIQATTSENGKKITKCSVCNKTIKSSTIYAASSVKLSTTYYTYDGKNKKPAVRVVDGKGNTISNSNYSVTYPSGRKSVGKYTVKVRFKGHYSGKKNLVFKIVPPKSSVSSLTAKSKAVVVEWKRKTTQVTGYQIQYSPAKNFKKGNKTLNIKSSETSNKKIKGLKGGKKYYVRIRTYKTVSGTNYYSRWSSGVVVKTKK